MENSAAELKKLVSANNTKGTQPIMTYEETRLYFSARDPECGKETVTYISDGVELEIDVFLPNKEVYYGLRPGVLFFFGGGFTVGCKEAFSTHCEELAKQGYVSMTANYRITYLHGTTPKESMLDGAEAWKYVRDNAERWNLDPERVAISGGSSGGMIAMMCGVLSGIQPKALALFNPAIAVEGLPLLSELKKMQIGNARVISTETLTSDFPPMLIQHGLADTAIPFQVVKDFADRANEIGLSCDLIAYPEMNHGFFNFNRSRAHYFMTLGQMMQFLDRTIGESSIMNGNDELIP